MIEELNTGFAFIILLSMIGGIVRVFRGPTRADRMLAAQLFGTAGVAIVLLTARSLKAAWLYDLALVFALLAAVVTVAFVRLTWHRNLSEKGNNRVD